MRQLFINEAFTQAIDDYLDSKNLERGIVYNSFLVIFIRQLINIYSELDIINPFMIESEETLKSNLTKYGYFNEKIDELFDNLQKFYEIDKINENLVVKKDNPYFIDIQKQLVDMLIAKKLNYNLTDEEVKSFYNLLYTPNALEPLIVSFNYLTAKDIWEVDKYFHHEYTTNEKVEEVKIKKYLNLKAYEIIGQSIENVNKMNSDELDKLNHQVYDYFKIRENAINKEYLLEKAIESFMGKDKKLTSGNGYVDILLVMSIICTAIMVVAVITVAVM